MTSGPRIILCTGKGGVGKTSVAAATARRSAAAGRRTLVLSTDPAHSLADALGVPVGAEPTELGPGLHAQQIDARAELERRWGGVRDWLQPLLVQRGVNRVSAEELTVPPGTDELFSLLQLQEQAASGRWDVVVVDCAPTGETLRLLSFPEVARWWLEKVFPQQGRLLSAARPIAKAVLDVELPGETVLEDVNRLVEGLISMDALLRDRERVSVRLVTHADKVVVDEARRTFTYLNLYGYLTDAVVVNRVFPEAVDGGFFGPWRERQQERLQAVRDAFAPVPVLEAPWFAEEPVGGDLLDRLGDAVYGGRDAAAVLHDTVSEHLELLDDGARLRLDLPFADRGDVSVKQIGLELLVRVDGHQRTLMLPPALAGYRPAGARLQDGALHVTFDA